MSIDPHGKFAVPGLQSVDGTEMVLDVAGESHEPGTAVILWPRKTPDAGNQRWQFVQVKPGWWTVHPDMETDCVLTVDTADPRTPMVVAPLQDDLEGQLWSLVPTWNAGYWYLQGAWQNRVVAAPADAAQGAQLVTADRSYDEYEPQAWGFSPSPL